MSLAAAAVVRHLSGAVVVGDAISMASGRLKMGSGGDNEDRWRFTGKGKPYIVSDLR